ncbi:MAG: hypothetical protein SVV80_08720 [Planctomycetota bacterium]|nr:hypothetical protein [Planctomycetota bacterium]
MSSFSGRSLGRLEQVAELEAVLLGRIEDAADELRHIECLDEEQRAEIHAILEAMKHDGQAHASAIRVMENGSAQETCHA